MGLRALFEQHGLMEHLSAFERERVAVRDLAELTEQELSESFGAVSFGDRKRFRALVASLTGGSASAPTPTPQTRLRSAPGRSASSRARGCPDRIQLSSASLSFFRQRSSLTLRTDGSDGARVEGCSPTADPHRSLRWPLRPPPLPSPAATAKTTCSKVFNDRCPAAGHMAQRAARPADGARPSRWGAREIYEPPSA
jgi:hypothetical protein